MAAPSLRDLFVGYFEPLLLLSLGVYFHLVVFLESIFRFSFNPSQIGSDAFARLWLFMSRAPPPSSDSLTSILSKATGTVLELGPGNGLQVKHFVNLSIRAIYGPEPCQGLHDDLRKKAADAGLAEKYHVLNCGGEMASLVPELAKAGVLEGGRMSEVFDSIVCVRVLCSISDVEETAKGLYALLRPGGKLIFCEHVVNAGKPRGDGFARLLQGLYMLMGWRVFLGNCHLGRDTVGVLTKSAGSDGWEKTEIEMQNEWSTIPYALGVMIKKTRS